MNSLVISEVSSFNGNLCEIYSDNSGDKFISRKQIGDSLEYADPNRAIEKIHRAHSDRLDGLSTVTKVTTVEGTREITRETVVYSLRGVLEICRWSRQRKANQLMDFVWDIIESSSSGNQPEVLKRVIRLEEQLSAAGILRPFVAPRYTMENLLTRYKQATGIDRVRTFYDDIGKWCGVKVPYANSIRIPVRDWIVVNLSLEHVQELVVGFETHTMTRSTDGYPVSLNGCFGNSVEWERTLKEFDYKCAYCGESHETLMAEHIIPQSVMSREQPSLCDSVGGIVPSCKTCNQNKGTSFMPTWFKKQPTYSDEKYWRIQQHQSRYLLNTKVGVISG